MSTNSIAFTVVEGVTVETFQQDLAEGKVRTYIVRKDDTMRHVPYMVEGTEERETAEWVMEQREEGVTMKEIAKALHLSVPSVRRMINGLLLAEEVEEFEAEDIAEILALAAQDVEITTEVTNDQQ